MSIVFHLHNVFELEQRLLRLSDDERQVRRILNVFGEAVETLSEDSQDTPVRIFPSVSREGKELNGSLNLFSSVRRRSRFVVRM